MKFTTKTEQCILTSNTRAKAICDSYDKIYIGQTTKSALKNIKT